MLRCKKNFNECDFHKYMNGTGFIHLNALFALLLSSKLLGYIHINKTLITSKLFIERNKFPSDNKMKIILCVKTLYKHLLIRKERDPGA